MVPRLDSGLKTVELSTELTPGMAFIVKYLNAATAKQDLWLGVHIPSEVAPLTMTRRPKKNASSDTPAEQRAYIFYLPGKNTYTWVQKKALYQVEKEPLPKYTAPGVEDGALYQKLHDLVLEDKDLSFWVAMAKKERSKKGPHHKEPGLVMPSEDEIDDEMAIDSDDSDAQSFDFGDGKHGVAHKPAPLLRSTPPPPVDPDEVVGVYVGHGQDYKVFQLTRRAIEKSSVLRDIVQGNPPYVMHPSLFHMETRAFELVYAFTCDETSSLGIERIVDDTADDEILGDVLLIGKSFILRDLDSAPQDDESISRSISELGKTYLIASSLGLRSMQEAIVSRLQVIWNVYCSAAQTLTILDIIEDVASTTYTGKKKNIGTDVDEPLLNWGVRFLSELFMGLVTEHTQRFTAFMQKHVDIQSSVFSLRALACSDPLGRLFKLEAQYMRVDRENPVKVGIVCKPEDAVARQA